MYDNLGNTPRTIFTDSFLFLTIFYSLTLRVFLYEYNDVFPAAKNRTPSSVCSGFNIVAGFYRLLQTVVFGWEMSCGPKTKDCFFGQFILINTGSLLIRKAFLT